MTNHFFHFFLTHLPMLLYRLGQHLYLSLSATLLAIMIGIPTGIWIKRQPRLRHPVLAIANVFQTIPSLALLAFLVPFLGIGMPPTVTTLTLYALLPIIRSTYTGLNNVDLIYTEAAQAMGFTQLQRLRLVELPLAMPVILSGVRVATVMTLGITTIAAFIGAGGLGNFIASGLALGDNRLILLGAIPTALLALLLDFLIERIKQSIHPYATQAKKRERRRRLTTVALPLSLMALVAGYPLYRVFHQRSDTQPIKIASKNFTESYVLAELMGQLITHYTHLPVTHMANLSTTPLIHAAMRTGSIDLYPEYVGTAYTTVLHHHTRLSKTATLALTRREYHTQFQFTWLSPFGFENNPAMAVKESVAKRYHLHTLSDLKRLAPQWTLAAPAEFLLRQDSYPLLKEAYHLTFKQVLQMTPALLYPAIANNKAHVIQVFTTDAKIKRYHLHLLTDNQHAYPSYAAGVVVRNAVLNAHPCIKRALHLLAGQLDENTMRQLNAQVDLQHDTPSTAAHHFLSTHHLLDQKNVCGPSCHVGLNSPPTRQKNTG